MTYVRLMHYARSVRMVTIELIGYSLGRVPLSRFHKTGGA